MANPPLLGLILSTTALVAAMYTSNHDLALILHGICIICLGELVNKNIFPVLPCNDHAISPYGKLKKKLYTYLLSYFLVSVSLIFLALGDTVAGESASGPAVRVATAYLSAVFITFFSSRTSLPVCVRNICDLRRPKQGHKTPIWRLPPELIQLIAKTASPRDAAAFALTSKAALACVGRQYLELQGHDRVKLLEHFQPEMPDHLLCYQCCTFHHKWKVMTGEHYDCTFTSGWVSMGVEMLLFADEQHALNAHLYGQKHQIPSIPFTYRANEESAYRRTDQDAELRISGDDILLVRRIEGAGNRFKDSLVNGQARRVLWQRYQERIRLARSPWLRGRLARRPTFPRSLADLPDSDTACGDSDIDGYF
ncbi:hypothetical protein FQN55_009604 [Onygenales sp. PD_40]|nr:hypothetical protein FQN55_009604 [Onygenales sp. PD_40]